MKLVWIKLSNFWLNWTIVLWSPKVRLTPWWAMHALYKFLSKYIVIEDRAGYKRHCPTGREAFKIQPVVSPRAVNSNHLMITIHQRYIASETNIFCEISLVQVCEQPMLIFYAWIIQFFSCKLKQADHYTDSWEIVCSSLPDVLNQSSQLLSKPKGMPRATSPIHHTLPWYEIVCCHMYFCASRAWNPRTTVEQATRSYSGHSSTIYTRTQSSVHGLLTLKRSRVKGDILVQFNCSRIMYIFS